MQVSLWHPKNCQHAFYGMTCQQYEHLRKRANDLCELCGTSWHPLAIDHDHRRNRLPEGIWEYARGHCVVRGLLCPKCNTHMGYVDRDQKPHDERTRHYVANAWHLQNLAPEVFPTPDPEPPLGAVVLAEKKDLWRRRETGWHPADLKKGSCHARWAKTWLYLSHQYGSKNLRVIRIAR